MINEIELRLGVAFCLSGIYAGLPVFQIVNDATDNAAAFTSRIIELEQGEDGDFYKSSPHWALVREAQADFRRRISSLNANAVKAAAISDDIIKFTTKTLDPLVEQRQWVGRGGRSAKELL